MSKRFKMFFYQLKKAFFSIFRNFSMTMTAAFAVSLTLILVSMFFIVGFNVQSITQGIKNNVQIRVGISNDITGKQQDELETKLKELKEVEKVIFVSKDEELKQYSQKQDQSDDLYEIYAGENNPLRDVFVVYIKKDIIANSGINDNVVRDLATTISNFEEVDVADYGGSNVDAMIKGLTYAGTIGVVIALALSSLAIFIISTSINTTIAARKDEISIMRNVGASNHFIRIPFVLEGVFIGIIGSIIPILLTVFGYQFLYNQANEIAVIGILKILPPFPFVWKVSLVLIAIAVIVGIIGSIFSLNRYLRLKR